VFECIYTQNLSNTLKSGLTNTVVSCPDYTCVQIKEFTGDITLTAHRNIDLLYFTALLLKMNETTEIDIMSLFSCGRSKVDTSSGPF
jgi:hypothetical protein